MQKTGLGCQALLCLAVLLMKIGSLGAQGIKGSATVFPILHPEMQSPYNKQAQFSYEKLIDAMLIVNFEPVYLKAQNDVYVLSVGTLMRAFGSSSNPDDVSVELADGRRGFVARKSVFLFPSETYLRKLQMQTRSTWNAFLEPMFSLSHKPVRVGFGLKISKVFFAEGLWKNKEGHFELSAYSLSVLKVRNNQPRLITLGASAEYYFRLGLGGMLMLGPSLGVAHISGFHQYTRSNFVTLAFKGRVMLSHRLGAFGEVQTYGFPGVEGLGAQAGVSLSF